MAWAIFLGVVAGVVLAILSNWLYDILRDRGVLPPRPSVKRILAVIAFAIPLIVLVALPNIIGSIQSKPSGSERNKVVELARLGRGSVGEVTWSPDGRLLAQATSVGLYLYDTNTYNDPNYIAEGFAIDSLSFSPDGQTIATTSDDGAMRVWSIPDGELVNSYGLPSGSLTRALYSPDKVHIASISNRSSIHVWNINQTSEPKHASFPSPVVAFAFTSDGTSLLIGLESGSIVMISVSNVQSIQVIADGLPTIRSLAISSDGTFLAAGVGEKYIRLWNLKTLEYLYELDAQSGVVNSLKFLPDGKHLVAMSAIYIEFWNVETRELLDYIENGKSLIINLDVSPDGNFVASSSYDQKVIVWNLQNKRKVSEFPYNFGFSLFSISPDGHMIAAVDRIVNHTEIVIWDAQQKLEKQRISWQDGNVHHILYADDGKLYIADYKDQQIRIWELVNERALINSFNISEELETDFSTSILFNKDVTMVAFRSINRRLTVWDINTGGVIFEYSFAENDVGFDMAFSPTEEIMAISSGQKIQLWYKETMEVRELQGRQSSIANSNITFSPNGKYVAIASDNSIYVWQVSLSELIYKVPAHTRLIFALDFSPNNLTLASVSADETIRLIRANDGMLQETIRGHSAEILGVKFSPKGDVIVSGSNDGTIRLWGPLP